MESSSNDSFLWTDGSRDSSDNSKNTISDLMETQREELPSGVKDKRKVRDTKDRSENKGIENTKSKTKKRRSLEPTLESNDYYHPEGKKIKLEPESDIDLEKKRKLGEEKIAVMNEAQHSILNDEEYLNLRVKQEQISFVKSKKKKKFKSSNSNSCYIDNVSESESTLEPNGKDYIEWRVKQEEASVVESKGVKLKKKKKKRKRSTSPDMDDESVTKSVTILREDTDHMHDDFIAGGGQTEYSIIEEKFSAEETVVEKPRKKKKCIRDASANEIIHAGINVKNVEKPTKMTSELDNGSLNNNNMSLEPSDFTCNNIVSSTIINSSIFDLKQNKNNQNEQLLNASTNKHPTRISDRIQFEEDDSSSQQEQHFSRTSAKINMFLKANPHLKLCALKPTKESLITNDDDIWTLTWPHEINLEKLRYNTVSFDGKSKIKNNGQTYEGVPNESADTITLLTHEDGQAFITNFPVKDSINYRKRIPKVHIPENNIMVNNQVNFMPLPETKCRHPLFGVHYKKAIKIPTPIVERLQAAEGLCYDTSSSLHQTVKKKKNKHKSVDVKMEDEDVEEYVYVKPEVEPLTKKVKNKKRKHSPDNNGPPKKSKRTKHSADSPAVWESEKLIEENLFNF